MKPAWRVGFELELMAPPGADRRMLAEAIAARRPGGSVRRVFHLESEPSAVKGKPVFHNLTLGFEALDGDGRVLARCLDDLTLQADLDRLAAPRPGWFRIVSDDARLLRLAARHAAPEAGLPGVLEPVAALFGTALEPGPGGMFRLVDDLGASVMIGAPLPGERERPCELVTPPLDGDRAERLGELVGVARELGFGVPREAALHIHYDAAALRDARVIADLVAFFARHGEALKTLVATNPACRRLGGWAPELVAAATAPDFATLPWPAAEARLKALEPTKYCDFNLQNLVYRTPGKDTFEVRVLPVSLDVAQVLAAAELFEAILVALCAGPLAIAEGATTSASASATMTRLIDALPLGDAARAHWLAAAAAIDVTPARR
ncbi:MAG: amidoligase family protein [Myxococcota bacterium]